MPRGKRKDYSALFGGLDLSKDRFDENREGFVDEHGNYHYVTGIGMRDAAVPPVVPLHDEDGNDNSEWIKKLADEDHGVNIQKRNAMDHEDQRYSHFKETTDPDSEDADTTPNPMDVESYRRWDEDQNCDDNETEDPIAEFVHEFFCMLSDDEQTIMFGVYGMDRKQKDIAAEMGKKNQSVSRSIQRIQKRLEKELAEKLNYHGEDRTKK